MLCKCVMHIHGVQNKKKERDKKNGWKVIIIRKYDN